MKKQFSSSWISSKKPRKQRKYAYNAPLHVKGRLMHSQVSDELRNRYGIKTLRVRKGDKVKLMRGQFRGKEGKVERVDLSRTRLYIETIEIIKKDGSKTTYPIHPSNVRIVEINAEDKKRMQKLGSGAKGAAAKKDASQKKETKVTTTDNIKSQKKDASQKAAIEKEGGN